MKKIAMGSLLFAMLGSASVYGEPIGDFSALLGDVNTSSPGIEGVIPKFVRLDTDGDGVFDTLKVLYNVYDQNKVVLYSTSSVKIAMPAPGCANPSPGSIQGEMAGSPKFIRQYLPDQTVRVHMALKLQTSCNEMGTGDWVATDKAAVYSADVSVAKGKTWSKSFNGSADGFNVFDPGVGFTSTDLVLTISKEIPDVGVDISVIVLNPSYGTVIGKWADLPVMR